jgi:CHAD domain-containing protein
MKTARDLAFAGIASTDDAVRYLLRVRFAECLEKQRALNDSDDEALHGFRLACKRLRFAIERTRDSGIDLKPVAALLSSITDELGAAHDCVVLARRAEKCNADRVARHALQDRNRYVRRAQGLWSGAFRLEGTFAPLASFTGFRWTLPDDGR